MRVGGEGLNRELMKTVVEDHPKVQERSEQIYRKWEQLVEEDTRVETCWWLTT